MIHLRRKEQNGARVRNKQRRRAGRDQFYALGRDYRTDGSLRSDSDTHARTGSIRGKKGKKQEEVYLWTSVEGNGSLHDGGGTIGRGLLMDIAKGVSICERM